MNPIAPRWLPSPGGSSARQRRVARAQRVDSSAALRLAFGRWRVMSPRRAGSRQSSWLGSDVEFERIWDLLGQMSAFLTVPIEQARKLAARALRRQIHAAADPQSAGQTRA